MTKKKPCTGIGDNYCEDCRGDADGAWSHCLRDDKPKGQAFKELVERMGAEPTPALAVDTHILDELTQEAEALGMYAAEKPVMKIHEGYSIAGEGSEEAWECPHWFPRLYEKDDGTIACFDCEERPRELTAFEAWHASYDARDVHTTYEQVKDAFEAGVKHERARIKAEAKVEADRRAAEAKHRLDEALALLKTSRHNKNALDLNKNAPDLHRGLEAHLLRGTLKADEGICDGCAHVVHYDDLTTISTSTLAGVVLCKECRPECKLPPEGWYCTRPAGHGGPCPTARVEPKRVTAMACCLKLPTDCACKNKLPGNPRPPAPRSWGSLPWDGKLCLTCKQKSCDCQLDLFGDVEPGKIE